MAENELTSQETIRALMAVCSILSIPLCIVAGAVTSEVLPALGVIPMVSSAIFNLHVLRGNLFDKTRTRHIELGPLFPATSSVHSARRNVALLALDLIHVGGLFGVLVPTWIMIDHRYYPNPVLLYGTFPIMLNSFLHLFLALRFLLVGILSRIFFLFRQYPINCPQCSHTLRPTAALRRPVHRGRENLTASHPDEEEGLYNDDPQIIAGDSARASLETDNGKTH